MYKFAKNWTYYYILKWKLDLLQLDNAVKHNICTIRTHVKRLLSIICTKYICIKIKNIPI